MAANNSRKERQLDFKMQCFTEQCRAELRERNIKSMEDKAANKRFNLQLHKERHEAEMEDKIMKAKEAEMMRRCELEQEERLAQQMDFMKRQEMRETKLRQRLRENCVELRELERQLKAAYSTKELLAQCAEKKAAQAMEKMYEKQAYDVLKDSWAKDEENMRKMQKEELRKKLELRQDLQDQLIETEKKRQKAYYEFLQEKHLIDEITSRILEEDVKRAQQKFLSQARAREEIEIFMKQREEESKKRKIQIAEEDKQYMIYLEQRAVQDEEVRRIMEEKKGKREELRYKLGIQLYEQEMRKMEHDEMLMELHEYQAQSERDAEHRAEVEREIRQRLELREMAYLQTGEKQKRLRQEEEDDIRWRKEMIAKFEEDDRLEQRTAQMRWEKKREYLRSVQQTLEDRRAARAEEMQRLLKEHEQEQCLEAARKKMIEEERQRMLCEHADALLGFLPRGLLKPEERPLGPDITSKMSELIVTKETEEDCKKYEVKPEKVKQESVRSQSVKKENERSQSVKKSVS